jgi:hypothetical protein
LRSLRLVAGPSHNQFSLNPTFKRRALDQGRPSFQRHHTDLLAGRSWGRNLEFYWHLRTFIPSRALQRISKTPGSRYITLGALRVPQIRILSSHLQFLLDKSAHSDNILGLAHRKVFRFRYLHRDHPTYMKKAFFLLRDTFNESQGRLLKSGLVSRFEGVMRGLLRIRYSFPNSISYVVSSS